MANCGFRIGLKMAIGACIAAAPVYAYVTAKTLSNVGVAVQSKWRPGAFPIRWQINPVKGANITGTVEQAEVFRTSFFSWQSVGTATVTFIEGAPTPTNIVSSYDNINLITTNITPQQYGSSALAFTTTFTIDQGGVVDQFDRPVDFPGQIMEADIMFNPSTQFSTNATTPATLFDLQSVAIHEIGHLLGLDHTNLVSSVMFPTLIAGVNYARTLTTDDIAGISTIYPSAAFNAKGTLSGTVRTTSNTAVFGAMVTAVNASGQPVASALTDPQGRYTIAGLDPGSYTVYAEALDQPMRPQDIGTLATIYSGLTVFTNFTTRFR